MISFDKLELNPITDNIIRADVVTSQVGAHLVVDQGHEPATTLVQDEEGRALARIEIPVTGDLPVEALISGEQNLGNYVFDHYPPKSPGVYVVAKGVDLTFIRQFFNDGLPAGYDCFSGPVVLRELVPPNEMR